MSTESQRNPDPAAGSLRDLYRRLDDAAVPAWLDGETLAGAVSGTLTPALQARVEAACAARPAVQALLDSLRALEPEAETLAAALAAAPQVARAHAAASRRHARHAVHGGRRRSRRAPWLAAAASLLLAVAVGGIWTLQQQHAPAETQNAAAPVEDDIFSASMDGASYASQDERSEDSIFRSDFKRS